MNRSLLVFMFTAGFLLAGCNPLNVLSSDEKKVLRQKKKCQRKYDRYVKKCGFVVDTIEVPVEATLDSQSVTKVYQVLPDTNLRDSLIERYRGLVDSLFADSDSADRNTLSSHIAHSIRYIQSQRVLTDTLVLDTTFVIMIDGKPYDMKVVSKVYQPNSESVSQELTIPTQKFSTTIKVEDERIPPPEFTWKEQLQIYLGKVWWIILIIIAVLFITWLYKRVVKNMIR